jgi:hypothetical protein
MAAMKRRCTLGLEENPNIRHSHFEEVHRAAKKRSLPALRYRSASLPLLPLSDSHPPFLGGVKIQSITLTLIMDDLYTLLPQTFFPLNDPFIPLSEVQTRKGENFHYSSRRVSSLFAKRSEGEKVLRAGPRASVIKGEGSKEAYLQISRFRP